MPTRAAALAQKQRYLLQAIVAFVARNGERFFFVSASLIGIVVALPLLSVLASLLQSSEGTLAHLASTVLGEMVVNTILLCLFVGIGTAVIGAGTAWLVTMAVFPLSRVFQWALLLPMAMPGYIVGYAYTDFLAFAGPVQSALRHAFDWGRSDYWFPQIQSVGGAAAMLALVLYPYVFLLARAAFMEQSAAALDVARTLGYGRFARFWRVALPLGRPAMAAGVALVLMETLADFGTVHYFGVNTFTTAIYRTWFGMGDRVAAGQLSSALVATALLLIWLERWGRSKARYYRSSRRDQRVQPIRLAGIEAWLATAACSLPIILGFVLPVGILLSLHLDGGESFLSARFVRLATTSFSIAAMAAVLITVSGFVIAYAMRLASRPRHRELFRLPTFGYALPGTVIAVGVMVPLGFIDNAIDTWMRSAFGVSTGLLLSGTVIALLFAYLVRFLALATGAIESGLQKIPLTMDHVARSLGTSVPGVMRYIHLPLLRRSLLTAALLVFVDVLKELPATLLVRPFDFDTLAVRVYQLASDERLAAASTGALVIVLIGVLPIMLLTRLTGAPGAAER